MITDIEKLQPKLQKIVRELISAATLQGGRHTANWEAGEVYAYQRPDRFISWGVHCADGTLLARGIEPPTVFNGRPE